MKSLKIYLVSKQRVMNSFGCSSVASFKLEDRSALEDDTEKLSSMKIGALIIGNHGIKKDKYNNDLQFVECNLLADCIRKSCDGAPWNEHVANFITAVHEQYFAVLYWC